MIKLFMKQIAKEITEDEYHKALQDLTELEKEKEYIKQLTYLSDEYDKDPLHDVFDAAILQINKANNTTNEKLEIISKRIKFAKDYPLLAQDKKDLLEYNSQLVANTNLLNSIKEEKAKEENAKQIVYCYQEQHHKKR